MPHSSETLEARARMRDAGCPERPDVNAGVRELKEELEARDQRPRPAGRNKAWLRAGGCTHGAIVDSWFMRARILQSLRAT